ncbi:MAG: hypothetical protein WD066_09930 [Planctomycetaceae bacterium]
MPRSRMIELAGGAWLAAAIALAAGCRLGQPTIEANRLSWSEQKSRIHEIAPVGTPRDEAVERLRAAGIDGEFGARDTIYYCGLWERPDGTHWQMDVALLFDADGRLYDLRPAEAEVRPLTEGPEQRGTRGRDGHATSVRRGETAGEEPQLRERPDGARP